MEIVKHNRKASMVSKHFFSPSFNKVKTYMYFKPKKGVFYKETKDCRCWKLEQQNNLLEELSGIFPPTDTARPAEFLKQIICCLRCFLQSLKRRV